jgi:hypothetical protein
VEADWPPLDNAMPIFFNEGCATGGITLRLCKPDEPKFNFQYVYAADEV